MKEDLQGNSSLSLGVGCSKHHDVSSVKPEGILDDDSNAGAGDFSVPLENQDSIHSFPIFGSPQGDRMRDNRCWEYRDDSAINRN